MALKATRVYLHETTNCMMLVEQDGSVKLLSGCYLGLLGQADCQACCKM